MAISRVITPPPNLGPAPAIPAGNFTKLANEIVKPPPHGVPPIPDNGPKPHAVAGAGGPAKSHKVDHAA